MAPLHLGLDIGTQSTKCLVYDSTARVVRARATVSYEPLRSPAYPRRAEQAVSTWAKAVRDSVRAAVKELGPAAKEIVSIGVSGQQHGMDAMRHRSRRVDRRAEELAPVNACWTSVKMAARGGELPSGLKRW
ncbi:hypothetical protein FOA52_013950 [Chlamydomonas sp. UWO 241]|nr:hypothetical protein FOA52_013950 [Chlamydomonas sp. UWO 241]